jgi:hypothetical protein
MFGESQRGLPDVPPWQRGDGRRVGILRGHESAYKLCANGTCATPQAVSPRPWVVFLPVDAAGKLDVRVRITSREGAVLLQAVSSVPVRHVDDSACGDEAYTGAVKVARSGVLTTS